MTITSSQLTALAAEARSADLLREARAARRRRHRRRFAAVTALCAAFFAASACGPAATIESAADTTAKAEAAATPAPAGPAEEIRDTFAALERYWAETLPQIAGVAYQPLTGLYAYDANDPSTYPTCGIRPLGPPDNAYYCPSGRFIAYDVGLVESSSAFGDAAFATVLAHELGHAIEHQLVIVDDTWKSEVRADCLAGGFTGWLAQQGLFEEGDAAAIGKQLASIADPRPDRHEQPDGHGSRSERIAAFSIGFNEGARACLGAL